MPDFLFPQMTDPSTRRPGWMPGLIDYLYVSFTNATAFSPTDTMPLTQAAKLLMSAQALTALLTIGLVVARAVNILQLTCIARREPTTTAPEAQDRLGAGRLRVPRPRSARHRRRGAAARRTAVLAREQGGFAGTGVCAATAGWRSRPPRPRLASIRPTASRSSSRCAAKALRDKVVLRVIAVDRAIHFLILVLLGVAVVAFAGNESSLRDAYYRILTDLQGGVAGGPVQSRGHVGILHELDKLFSLRSGTLREVGIGLLAYGLLEGIEAVGLWFAKRWAEYLTFLATTILLPLEIYEIIHRRSA